MTRIVHLITGLGVGGVELSLHRLLANLTADERRQHQVVCMTPLDVVADRIRQLGVSVNSLEMARGSFGPAGVIRLLQLLVRTPDWRLHAWMYHANLLATLASLILLQPRRVMWSVRNSLTHLPREKKLTQLVIRMGAWLSWCPVRIVYVARRSADQHEQLGYCRARTQVIPGGYDVTAFAPDAAARARLRGQLGTDNDVPLIGVIGRWDWTKDHANFLSALAQVPGAHAVLVGKDMTAENPALLQLLMQAGVRDRVHLLGRRDDVAQIMPGLDLLCLPSVTESMPNVVGEAMACAVPCVVTDVGDAAALVGGTGWIVPPQDSPALAGALRQALGAELAARGRQARERVLADYTQEMMVQRYRKLYRELGWT